jgi:hypothetical protein
MNAGLFIELGMQIVRNGNKGGVFATGNTVVIPSSGIDVTRICIISTEEDDYVTVTSEAMFNADILVIYLIAAASPFTARRLSFVIPTALPRIHQRFNYRFEADLISTLTRYGFKHTGASLV